MGGGREADPGIPGITPDGTASKGQPEEQLIPGDRHERLIYARRIVAQRCLYGVDKNPLAAEMAKLSLWLLTLAKDKPFTFLDHAIRCGDSLVGVSSIDQLLKFSLTEKPGSERSFEQLPQQIESLEATRLLRKRSRRCQRTRRRNRAEDSGYSPTSRIKRSGSRYAADLLLARAGSRTASRADSAQRDARRGRLPVQGTCTPTLEVEGRLGYGRRGSTARFTGLWSSPRSSWTGRVRCLRLQPAVHGREEDHRQPRHGLPGLPRRALAEGNGATPTCAPTSSCGLHAAARRGSVRLPGHQHDRSRRHPRGRARSTDRKRMCHPPSGSQPPVAGQGEPRSRPRLAARGRWNSPFVLDDKTVSGITSFLTEPGTVIGPPHRLAANAGKSFTAPTSLGMGFVLSRGSPALIDKNPQKQGRAIPLPQWRGPQLPTRPVAQPMGHQLLRLAARPEDSPDDYEGPVAADYPDCLAIVEEKVKPERTRATKAKLS